MDGRRNETVSRGSWPEYLKGFSGQHHGWLVTIQTSRHGAEPATVVREQPLDAIGVLPNGSIEISISADPPITHRVSNPSAIRIVESAPRATESLTIESVSERTDIRFRTALPPEMVDGVIP